MNLNQYRPYKWLFIIFVIVGVMSFFLKLSHPNREILAFWQNKNNSCHLSLIFFPEKTKIEQLSFGLCDYMIQQVNGENTLFKLDYGAGKIEQLDIVGQKIIIEREFLIPNGFTDVPQLSQDGSFIYFSSLVDTIEQIYVLNVENPKISLLVEGLQGTVTQPRLSPDKKYLTYIHNSEINNRYECLLVANGPSPYRIVTPECLFNGDVYLVNLQTSEVINLTITVRPKLNFACEPKWSPNSQYLTVKGSCIDMGGVALINVQNNYQPTFFDDALSGGQWLSNDYFLYTVEMDEIIENTPTYFPTVIYSVSKQEKLRFSTIIASPYTNLLIDSFNHCFAGELDFNLTIYCFEQDSLELDSYPIQTKGSFSNGRWSNGNLLAIYRQNLLDEGETKTYIDVFDPNGVMIYEFKLFQPTQQFSSEPYFGWLEEKN